MATPEQITTIGNLSRFGFTQHFISGAIGISTSTLSDWKRNNPLVATALSIGTDGVLSDVKSRMYQIAVTGSEKGSIAAGTFLINRYEVDDAIGSDEKLSNAEIKSEILDEITT